MSTSCFFKKLVSWEDPNLSATFLTAGNAVVLLLLLSGDALGWLQFVIIFGLLPLGLLARLTGYDRSIQGVARRTSPKARDYYEMHIAAHLTVLGLIRAGIITVIAANLVSVLGFPLTIGIAGNMIMLAPVVWASYKNTVLGTLKSVPVKNLCALAKQTYSEVTTRVAAIGPMAPAAVGGLVTFASVLVAFQLVFSQCMFVALMKTAGYLAVLVFGLAPASVVQREILDKFLPSPESVEALITRASDTKWTSAVLDIMLWRDYVKSVTAFVVMYAFYFVSSFTGAAVPAALLAGSVVAFKLTPSVYTEKVVGEVTKVVSQVREKVNSVIPKAAAAAHKVKMPKGGEPGSPKSGGKKGPVMAQPVSPKSGKPVAATPVATPAAKPVARPAPVEVSPEKETEKQQGEKALVEAGEEHKTQSVEVPVIIESVGEQHVEPTTSSRENE